MGKKINLYILIAWPLIGSFIAYGLKLNMMFSTLLLLTVPAIYLSFFIPAAIKKGLVFSSFSVLAMLVVDYIAHITEQWVVPYSVAAFRLFGVVPLEDIVGIISSVYFVVLFYEYFLDSHPKKERIWYPRMKFFSGMFILLFIAFVICFLLFPEFLLIPRFYFWMGIFIILLPFLVEIIRKPLLLMKFLTVEAYFFYVLFLYEIVGLKLEWWLYPGIWYIGTVTIAGLTFPFEELFFWILLFAMGTLAYYEALDDDEK